jgi:hypothetical protein
MGGRKGLGKANFVIDEEICLEVHCDLVMQ